MDARLVYTALLVHGIAGRHPLYILGVPVPFFSWSRCTATDNKLLHAAYHAAYYFIGPRMDGYAVHYAVYDTRELPGFQCEVRERHKKALMGFAERITEPLT